MLEGRWLGALQYSMPSGTSDVVMTLSGRYTTHFILLLAHLNNTKTRAGND